MRRRTVRPYGHTVSPTRIVSLIFAVGLLWVFYDRAKQPETWRFLTGETDDTPAAAAPQQPGKPAPPAPPENLARGPNDRDPAEAAEVRSLLDEVTDKTPLRPREMNAYWRLMNWSRVEPFRDLERRAAKVQFTQLFKQPGRYRGKLVQLRLHVRQIIDWQSENADAARNGDAPPTVYEIRGVTDDSVSNPYLLVVPELPKGLKVGADVRGEVVFVGYFLKVMSYPTVDAQVRGAPLLIGRVRAIKRPAATRPEPVGSLPWPWVVAGTAAIIGLGLWSLLSGRRSRRAPLDGTAAPLPLTPNDQPQTGDPAFRFDFAPHHEPVIMPPEPPRRPDGSR